MTVVMTPVDAISMEWGGISGELYIILNPHTGGTWVVEIKDPDGEWVNISPTSGGMDEAGMYWYKSSAAIRYRLSGGTLGAKAWVTNANGLDVEVF